MTQVQACQFISPDYIGDWLYLHTCQEESDFRTVKTNERQEDGERFSSLLCALYWVHIVRTNVIHNCGSD